VSVGPPLPDLVVVDGKLDLAALAGPLGPAPPGKRWVARTVAYSRQISDYTQEAKMEIVFFAETIPVVCWACGKTEAEHIGQRHPDAPVPRMPCLMLKENFRAREPNETALQTPHPE